MLQLPDGEFSAYLFDCDGTIADSMHLHYRAWREALREWGAEFPKDLFYAWAGIPVPRTVEMLNEKYGTKMPVDLVTNTREENYFRLMSEVTVKEEVQEVILRVHGTIPMGVVSGSPRSSVIKTLTNLNLLSYFDTIVGGEECARGKPNPDPYLLAASRLQIPAKKCLVFEDAELGIASAKAAGMAWVLVK